MQTALPDLRFKAHIKQFFCIGKEKLQLVQNLSNI